MRRNGRTLYLRNLFERMSRNRGKTTWTREKRSAWPPSGWTESSLTRDSLDLHPVRALRIRLPQGVEILKMMQKGERPPPKEKVPGPIHKGVVMDLQRGTKQPRDPEKTTFFFLLADLSKELEEEGFPGFHVPVDKKGANVLVTINSKEPFGEPDDMKFWWRIFYAAKEDWTVPSVNWEGVNWGLFSGDDESMKTLVGRIVEHMERLECKTLLLPE